MGHRPYLICNPDTDPYRPNRGRVGMLHLVWQPNVLGRYCRDMFTVFM